jgi:hypothetical protein
MAGKNDGGPAFPGKRIRHNSVHYDEALGRNVFDTEEVSGMSLRDWFAGQGIVAYTQLHIAAVDEFSWSAKQVAKEAYEIADAMLKKREKKGGE